MISPDTPIGTMIICIDDEDHGKYVYCIVENVSNVIKKYRLYTVQSIMPHPWIRCGFGVSLIEIPKGNNCACCNKPIIRAFALERFKKAVLPQSLTKILEKKPTLQDIKELEGLKP